MFTPRVILRIEGFVFLIATIWMYYTIGASWWWFALLLFLPDVSMVGYLKNPHLGAFLYNLGHNYVLPVVLLGLSIFFEIYILFPLSLVWIVHVSMDRALGFGLKHETHFKDTHLGKIGK
jgi:hypothetical protein